MAGLIPAIAFSSPRIALWLDCIARRRPCSKAPKASVAQLPGQRGAARRLHPVRFQDRPASLAQRGSLLLQAGKESAVAFADFDVTAKSARIAAARSVLLRSGDRVSLIAACGEARR
jgi:hypothetical protein